MKTLQQHINEILVEKIEEASIFIEGYWAQRPYAQTIEDKLEAYRFRLITEMAQGTNPVELFQQDRLMLGWMYIHTIGNPSAKALWTYLLKTFQYYVNEYYIKLNLGVISSITS